MSDLPVPLPAEVDLRAMPVLDLKDWLEDVVPKLALLERWTDEARLLVGVALWRYRSELSDTAYAIEKDRLAKLADRTPRTVDGWRTEAEQKLKLVAPTARSQGQRNVVARREVEALRARKPGAAQSSDQPKVDKVVDNSEAGSTALSRWKTATRELRDDLGARAAAKILRQVADDLDPAPKKPAPSRPVSGNGQTAGQCQHPVNRRIGSNCGECGASMKAVK